MSLPDHYEALQVSPRADGDTIDRVFRHLAKRLHPDNQESGDAEIFIGSPIHTLPKDRGGR